MEDISQKQALAVILVCLVAIAWLLFKPAKAAMSQIVNSNSYDKQPWYLAYNYPVLSVGTPPKSGQKTDSSQNWMGVL